MSPVLVRAHQQQDNLSKPQQPSSFSDLKKNDFNMNFYFLGQIIFQGLLCLISLYLIYRSKRRIRHISQVFSEQIQQRTVPDIKTVPKQIETLPESIPPPNQSYSKKKSVSQLKRHQTIDLDDLGNDDERPTYITRQQSKVGSSSYFKAQKLRTKQKKKTINLKAREEAQKVGTPPIRLPETLNSDRDVFADFFESNQAPKLSKIELLLQENILRISMQQGLIIWLNKFVNSYIAVGIALEIALFARLLRIREFHTLIYALIIGIHAFALLSVLYIDITANETYYAISNLFIELVIEYVYLQQ